MKKKLYMELKCYKITHWKSSICQNMPLDTRKEKCFPYPAKSFPTSFTIPRACLLFSHSIYYFSLTKGRFFETSKA